MLDVLILAILALTVVFFVLFVALCLAIRREDRSPRLTPGPPTTVTAVARRVLGLTVRHPAPPTPDQHPGPHLALWGGGHSADPGHEGR
jgi:hypothetical protein